ncbi:ArsR family transcriptional regulator [Streptomyces sp. NPDC051940]|uniref:ArsR/SmtB family transcription factor n=1 Tax=Streptomyces sp. NPDC051940 TaxID=3155675 RepID=UPI00341B2678
MAEEGELLPQPAAEEIELVRVLHALADPARLWLFRLYAQDGELGCSPEAVRLGHLHKSTVSHHFKVLREAGLTSTRAVGRERRVRLRREELDRRFPGLVDALLTATDGGRPPLP